MDRAPTSPDARGGPVPLIHVGRGRTLRGLTLRLGDGVPACAAVRGADDHRHTGGDGGRVGVERVAGNDGAVEHRACVALIVDDLLPGDGSKLRQIALLNAELGTESVGVFLPLLVTAGLKGRAGLDG